MSSQATAATHSNMAFQLAPEESAFLDRVREFVANEVLPNTREWENNTAFPPTIWARLGELGLLGMTVSKQWGGQSLSCAAYCEACRELAKGDPALSMNVAAINALCVSHIEKFGTEEQKEKYLNKCVTGEIKLAWGLTEPDAGSDARRVQTVAVPIEGEPSYFHLNGEKMFITNGGNADLIILIARSSETELSAYLMETNQPGWSLTERIQTIGVRASNTVRFKMTDAVGWHTPCTFEQAIGFLYRGRLGIGAMALGIAEKSHELAVDYSKQRVQFNRRLCDMQSVQNMIADSATDIAAARLLIRDGAAKYDRNEDHVSASSMAKLFASEAANRVTNRSIQIHGGRGMTFEFLVEKLWRDAKLCEIGEGCSEIQRMIISKQAVK